MSNVLIQHACGPLKPCLEATQGYHERYAMRHGFTYVWTTQMGTVWTKFGLIRAVLETRKPQDIVVWLDADCIIVRPEVNLADALPPGAAAAAGRMPGSWLHSGVMYFRAKPPVVAWMRRCEANANDETGLEGSPIIAVDRVFNETMGDVHVAALGPEWNCWTGSVGDANANTVVRAFHGLPVAHKLAALKRTLQEVDGG